MDLVVVNLNKCTVHKKVREREKNVDEHLLKYINICII